VPLSSQLDMSTIARLGTSIVEAIIIKMVEVFLLNIWHVEDCGSCDSDHGYAGGRLTLCGAAGEGV